MKQTLRNFLCPQPKSKIKAGEGQLKGAYNFYTSSQIQSKFYHSATYTQPALIFGTGGMASVHYCNEPFSTSTDCLVMYGCHGAPLELIYYYLRSNMHLLQDGFKGAGLQHISKDYILNINIDMPAPSLQEQITHQTRMVDAMINGKKQQILSFDEAVKSRFIELFGTVKDNPYHFPTATLKEVCHKITDGKHGGCEQEADSGYYFVGAREIYDGVIHYDTAPQITYSDFAKDYRRCNIEQGDMVIVNTGATIGKSAIASSPLTERTLLQKSVALLKVKTDVISAEFLRYCYMANPSMYMVESASAQPNLLLSKMNATVIYLPPLELQQQFAAFVEQTDKLKVAVQKSLDETQLLFDSLMQKYFG